MKSMIFGLLVGGPFTSPHKITTFCSPFKSRSLLNTFFNIGRLTDQLLFLFLGANAHLGPASSEGLSVCLYVCLCICNTLAPLPSPMTKMTKMTNKQREKQTNKEIERQR